MSSQVLPRFDEVHDLDESLTAYSYFTPSESVMKELVEELFVKNWKQIVVGPCVEGAVFEIQFVQPPEIRISDGYLTVDLRSWHFHLCIGAHKGTSSEELRRVRPVNKIALFERRGKGCGGGRSWGLKLWNGYGEQMTTVFLPNPRLTDDMQWLKTPDWKRLELYYHLRQKFLGDPMPENLELAANQPLPGTELPGEA
jgi:hypothetical protein